MLKEGTKYKNLLNYILVYLLIGFSGIPFFDANKKARLAFLVILGGLFFYYRKKIGKELLIFIPISIFVILFQSLYFGGGKLFTTITMISLLIVMPYFAVKIVGPQFLKYYRDIMVVIAMISIGFWIAVNIVPGLNSALQTLAIRLGSFYDPVNGIYNVNIIVYSYEFAKVYGLTRNPGPFHEPGAYSVFLMLAIVAEIFMTGKLMTRNNMFFFANLITTFSTAGFLGLFVVVGFYVFSSHRMTFLTKVVISGSMFAVIIYLFLTLEFLGDKISSQVQEQTETQLNTATSGRFLGARKALIVLYRYPLFGRGLIAASQANATSDEAAGYGWIRWVSRIGIIFGLLYMFLLYKSLRNYSIINLKSKTFALFAFGAILAVLSGQKHTSSLTFFMMMLMPIVFPYHTYWQDYIINTKNKKHKRKKRVQRMTLSERASFTGSASKKGLLP